MPSSTRSVIVTDRYRSRAAALRAEARRQAERRWHSALDLRDLDTSHARWRASTAPAVERLQRTGVVLSTAYVGAYLTAERGRTQRPLTVDAGERVGSSRSGKPLLEALAPSLYTIKQAIGAGQDPTVALATGLARALNVAGEEAIAPARETLADQVADDDRIIGWRRVTSGGCGACLGAATGAIHADDELLEVHDHCECQMEPVVADTSDKIQRPTGADIFASMPTERQDALLGTAKADLIRSGDVSLEQLIAVSPMDAIPDQITEAPLSALLQHT